MPGFIHRWSIPASASAAIPHSLTPLLLHSHSFVSNLLVSWVLLDELDTLGDVALKIGEGDVQKLLLILGDLANWVDLLSTVGAELDERGKVLNTLVLVERRVNEGGLEDVLLALGGLEKGFGEAGSGHSHGEGSGTSTVLGLDDLVTAELHTVDIVIELLALEVEARLREEGNNGGARVATYNGDILIGRVGVPDLRDEAGGTDNVESSDTEEALWVVDTLRLEDLGSDGHGGVHLKLSIEILPI